MIINWCTWSLMFAVIVARQRIVFKLLWAIDSSPKTDQPAIVTPCEKLLKNRKITKHPRFSMSLAGWYTAMQLSSRWSPFCGRTASLFVCRPSIAMGEGRGEGSPLKRWKRKNGGFHKWGYPKMDGLWCKIPSKWVLRHASRMCFSPSMKADHFQRETTGFA